MILYIILPFSPSLRLSFSFSLSSLRPVASVSSSPGTQSTPQHPPAVQLHVSTTQVGPHPTRPLQPQKRVPVPPLREPTMPSVLTPVLVVDHSRSPCLRSHRWYVVDCPEPPGHGDLDDADSDLMHHQHRLSVLQWNPSPARRTPTQIIAATCGRFHAVTQQEASVHVPQVSDQFIAYTSDRPCHLAPQGHFRAQRCSLFLTKLRQARTRGVWQFFWFEGFCDALPFPAPPRSLFALSTSTMLRPRNTIPPLICSDGCTHT